MLVTVVTCVLVALVCCDNAAGWSYEDVDRWADAHAGCGGSNQSPIDIIPSKITYKNIGFPKFTGYDVIPVTGAFELKNTGHSVEVDIKAGEFTLTSEAVAGTYKLEQFHIHWGSTDCRGSEHTVDQLQFPAEMHFVHHNIKYGSVTEAIAYPDGVFVLGVMIDIGNSAHAAFAKITDSLPNVQYAGQTTEIESFKLIDLLPRDTDFFVGYSGSFTTPECQEGVTWHILRKSIAVLESQIAALRQVYDEHYAPLVDNFRPSRDPVGRDVYKNYDEILNPGTQPSHKTCT